MPRGSEMSFQDLIQALSGSGIGGNPFGDMPDHENMDGMEEMLRMMNKGGVKTSPKPAGQIIADAQLEGKKAESRYIYMAVEALANERERLNQTIENQQKEHRAEIERYEVRLQQYEEHLREVARDARGAKADLEMAKTEKKTHDALIASLKELIGKGNGSKTPKVVLEARALLGI